MIQKHVDLFAIALLLAAMAFYSQAHNALLHGTRSSRIAWPKAHYEGSRTTLPAFPRIPFARD